MGSRGGGVCQEDSCIQGQGDGGFSPGESVIKERWESRNLWKIRDNMSLGV